MSLTVNGLSVASMRWLASWSGVWTAELELQSNVELVPSGRVAIASTEGLALVGTVDPAHSGTFAERKHVRVVGGGGGWSKPVRSQHYHSDVGVQLQVLASTTASEVGEVVTVLAPKVAGVDFVRRAGPASQIFTDAGVDWWVGTDGVTRVGTRLPVVPPTSLEVLDWDPEAGTMRFTASVLVEPGTVIVDTRFGRRVVRQVEAKVSGGSVTGTLWVAEASPSAGSVSELVDGLAALAREATRSHFGRVYEYRVIAMAGDRVELQAVRSVDGVPSVLPASVWAGVSGYRATLRPASRVLVGFIAGDPRQPYVAAYEPPEADGWRPVKLELDAIASLEVGSQAVAVKLGETLGAQPIARAPSVVAFASALVAALGAQATAATNAGAVPVLMNTLGPILGALATALGTPLSTLIADCPSKKVVSS